MSGFYGFCEYGYEKEAELNNELNRAVTYTKGDKVKRTVKSLVDQGAELGVFYRSTHTQIGGGYRGYLIIDDMPLHRAISAVNVSGVRALLKYSKCAHYIKRQFLLRYNNDGDVEYKISVESPLHLLQYGGGSRNMTILKILLESNTSNPNFADHNGQTPIYRAIEHENIEAIDLLLDHGAKIDISDHQGRTPLHIAAMKNNAALVLKFLELGANPNAKDYREKIPSQMTTDLEIEKLFLEKKVSSSIPFNELHSVYKEEISHLSDEDKNQFILFAALKYGSLKAITKALHKLSLDTISNLRDASGRNLLHWAAIRDDPNIMRFLCRRNINPYAVNLKGKIPLKEARSSQVIHLLREEMRRCGDDLM